ncbi:MAG: hypothetical protein AABZ33_07635 [Chloroflexota bacterium]
MTTATTPVRVAPRTVRMRPGQLFWWADDYLWREGPRTPDGFWMVERTGYPARAAVRVIHDDDAPERTGREFARALTEARDAEKLSAEDDYLAALTVAAEIPADELLRLRDAVRVGRAGGSADGRVSRKRAKS